MTSHRKPVYMIVVHDSMMGRHDLQDKAFLQSIFTEVERDKKSRHHTAYHCKAESQLSPSAVKKVHDHFSSPHSSTEIYLRVG
jgi:hypothetical protein